LNSDGDKKLEQLTYQKFMEDPLGKKKKLRREEEMKQRTADTFVDSIKFIENTEQNLKGRRPINLPGEKTSKITLLEAR